MQQRASDGLLVGPLISRDSISKLFLPEKMLRSRLTYRLLTTHTKRNLLAFLDFDDATLRWTYCASVRAQQ